MPGSVLLDSNAAIQILNRQLDLPNRLSEGRDAFLCLTVVGELIFGAERSNQPETNRSKILQLLEVCPLVPQDLGIARRYGALKADLRRQGRPIPENDLWIAASALRYGLTLITRDHHFDAVEGLRTEDW